MATDHPRQIEGATVVWSKRNPLILSSCHFLDPIQVANSTLSTHLEQALALGGCAAAEAFGAEDCAAVALGVEAEATEALGRTWS